MRSDVYEWIWVKLGMIIDDTSLVDLDLDSRPQECKKSKTSTPTISQSFQLIWVEFGTLLRIFSLMNLIPILSCSFTDMISLIEAL